MQYNTTVFPINVLSKFTSALMAIKQNIPGSVQLIEELVQGP